MVWVKNGTTTLNYAGDDLDVFLTPKQFNQTLIHTLSTAARNHQLTLDNNTNSDYTWRQSINGGSDTTVTSDVEFRLSNGIGGSDDAFSISYSMNVDSEEKLFITSTMTQNGTGEANAPSRGEYVAKVDTTTNTGQFSRMDLNNDSAGDYLVGSNISVLGTSGGEVIQEKEVRNDHIETLIETDTQERYNLYPEIGRVKQGVPAVGGWVELGRTILGGATDDLAVSDLANKRYYQILFAGIGSGTVRGDIRLNSDTGSDYSSRNSSNGGADGSDGTTSSMNKFTNGDTYANLFGVGYLSNLSTREKLFIGHSCNNKTGVTNVPDRREMVGKYAQTTNPISAINVWQQSTGDWNTGSELVVLGWDENDTHSSNFWQPLANVKLGSDTSTIDSGVFTAKKYLWVQFYAKMSTTADGKLRVGNNTVDTGSNYTGRTSADGGADTTDTSQTAVQNIIDTGSDIPNFGNMFIINNASNEKLMILHKVAQNTAGATTAPQRRESVWKWADATNQIDRIELSLSTGNYRTGSWIKVWGAD